MSTAWLCIIILIIVDFFFLGWIYNVNNAIKTIENTESTICPIYFCDFYTDPQTGNLEPGSLCYNNLNNDISQNTGTMVAYRYTNSDKTSYSCQKTYVQNNIVI